MRLSCQTIQIHSGRSIGKAIKEVLPILKKGNLETLDQVFFTDFWQIYRKSYQGSLADIEKGNLETLDQVFFTDSELRTQNSQLSSTASRAALFIMLYRGYPLLQQPFQLLNCLLEIDEQLSSWRYRHMNMVHRMIGTRIGTGGSSGKDYLKAAADKHYVFREIAQLNSFLIERRKLPALAKEMETRLGFVQQ